MTKSRRRWGTSRQNYSSGISFKTQSPHKVWKVVYLLFFLCACLVMLGPPFMCLPCFMLACNGLVGRRCGFGRYGKSLVVCSILLLNRSLSVPTLFSHFSGDLHFCPTPTLVQRSPYMRMHVPLLIARILYKAQHDYSPGDSADKNNIVARYHSHDALLVPNRIFTPMQFVKGHDHPKSKSLRHDHLNSIWWVVRRLINLIASYDILKSAFRFEGW